MTSSETGMDSLLSVKLDLQNVFTRVATAMQRHPTPTTRCGSFGVSPICFYLFSTGSKGHCLWFVIGGFRSYCDQNPILIFQIFLIDFIPGLQTSKDGAKILKIQINFWDRKSAIKCRVLAELSFPHASYLVQDVRMADIRLASLVYLPCLR